MWRKTWLPSSASALQRHFTCMILSGSFCNSSYGLKDNKTHCVFLPPSFPCRLVQQPTKLLKRKEFSWKFHFFYFWSSSNMHFESVIQVTKSPACSFVSPWDAVKIHWWASFKIFFRYKWFFTEHLNEMHQVTALTSKSSSESTAVSWPMRYWWSAVIILFFKIEQHLSCSSYASFILVSLLYHEIKPQSISGGVAAALERMQGNRLTTISKRRMLKCCPCILETKSEKPYCHVKEIL